MRCDCANGLKGSKGEVKLLVQQDDLSLGHLLIVKKAGMGNTVNHTIVKKRIVDL